MDGADNGPLSSTTVLLARARCGDDRARDDLLARYLPRLQCWAHGRLPGYARGPADTDDLVQVTLIRAFNHMGDFEVRHEGAFLAYVRRILLNSIRDEIRRAVRRGASEELDENALDTLPSPVERAIGRQHVEAYEAALASLPELQQEAVILRIELGMTYPEIAAAIGSPSANAARMTVTRALARLVEVLRDAPE